MAPSWTFSHAAALVARQSIGNEINNVKGTFSSWDSCMSKTYCKWPVIAAIIVGSLIALSIIFCVVRCCCCGMECCYGICSCCNACCPGGRRGNKQYQPAPQQQPMYPPPGWGPPPSGPAPWQPQPSPQNTMMYGGAAGFPQQPSAVPTVASYEQAPKREKSSASAITSPTRGAEDQLPAMPSWAAAREHHVEDTSYQPAEDKAAVHAQESQPLQEPRLPSPAPAAAAPVYTDNIPLQDRRSPPARTQTTSPGQSSSAYGPGSEYAASNFGQETSYNGPTMAYGAGAAALGATNAARYPPEKPALNTDVANPNAFARLPHASSPISPITPAASSVYTTNPPPSYTTNAYPAPSTRTVTPGPAYSSPPPQQTPYQAPTAASVAAPARSQSPYSAYNPYPATSASPPPMPTPAPAYQAYNPFSATSSPQQSAAPAELGGQPRAEMGISPSWGEGPQRRPAPGWRDV